MALLDAKRAAIARAAENARVSDLSFSSSPISPAKPVSGTDAPYGRAEPHLDDGPEQQRERAAREWVRYAALHEQPRLLKPRRRWPGIGWILGIFTFGAAAGLGVAWWLTTPSPLQMTPANVARVPATVHVPDVTPGGKGIAPSELPYDGQPPPGQGEPAIALKPANPEEVPQTPRHAALASEPAGTTSNAGSDLGEVPASKRAAAMRSAPASNAAMAETRQAGAIAATKSPERKMGVRRAPTRNVKDREIERIKQQAAEELKKKSEARRGGSEARLKRSKPERPATHSMRAMLARCDRAPNFILREQCKWQLCSGKWGKYGCPSYQAHASAL